VVRNKRTGIVGMFSGPFSSDQKLIHGSFFGSFTLDGSRFVSKA
jgi:hypothetical protein